MLVYDPFIRSIIVYEDRSHLMTKGTKKMNGLDGGTGEQSKNPEQAFRAI